MKNTNSIFSDLVSKNNPTAKLKLFLIRVYQKSKENDILIHAMGMVYMTLLSIVPFLLFLFYIMTLFDFFERFDSIINQLRVLILNNLATGTGENILNYLEVNILNIDIKQLGAISFFSLVMLTVFMLARIEITFNRIWNVEDHRDIFKRFVAFWTFITLGTFIITLFSSMTYIFIERYMGMWFSDIEAGQSGVFNWFMFSLNFFLFIIAYYFIPNTKVEPSAAIFAGLISGTLFIFSKNIYSIYTNYMVSYRKIYGSLSVIPIFLVWIYLIWLIVLMGAVISYVFQNRNILYYKNKKASSDQTIKNLIPSAVLINIYKNFLNEKTDGTAIDNLREKIKLPAEEIQKALKILKEKKYIAETKEEKFVPATNISNIHLRDIYGANYLNKDIKLEKVFKDPEVKIIYNHLKDDIEKSFKKINLEKILNKNLD